MIGGGMTAAAEGAETGALPSAAVSAPLSCTALGERRRARRGMAERRATGAAVPDSWAQAGGAGGQSGGSGREGPPAPLPPRCGAIPPCPAPWTGQQRQRRPRGGPRSTVGNCDPLGNDDAAAAAVAGKADDAEQENNNRSGNNGDDDKDNDKSGRGASFNSSSSSSSSVVGHLVSNAIATAGLLLSGIVVPRIDVQHRDSLRPRRRRTSNGLTKDDGRREKWPHAEAGRVGCGGCQ